MITSIYIANERVQAVMGEAGRRGLKIQTHAATPLPEGVMINGVITDERALRAALEQLRRDYPSLKWQNVRLCIDSSAIYYKQMRLPALRPKRMLELVRGEFADMENAQELLCDYAVLQPRAQEGGVEALLCAVKREMVESYVQLLKESGIALGAVNTALDSQIKLVRNLPALREQTFIIMVLDGNVLGAAVFVKGQFRFANRSRLLAERGSEGLQAEVERAVSTLIQFNQSQKSGEAVTHLYLAGLRPQERELQAEVCRAFGLRVGQLSQGGCEIDAPDGFDMADYAYAAGNLFDF